MISRFLPYTTAALAFAWVTAPAASRADIVVYNNVNTIYGTANNNGATSATGNTLLLADDIMFAGGYAGLQVTSFTLAVSNVSSTTETAQLTAEFFLANGPNGGPGTLLSAYSTGAISFANGLTNEAFAAPNLFTIPASGKIWAGFYFTGAASGSLNALNSLGTYTEQNSATGGPTIGTSVATFFTSTSLATSGTSSPAGSISNPYSGQPGNFGIIFNVPEPSSVLFMALGGAGLAGLIARRRRKA